MLSHPNHGRQHDATLRCNCRHRPLLPPPHLRRYELDIYPPLLLSLGVASPSPCHLPPLCLNHPLLPPLILNLRCLPHKRLSILIYRTWFHPVRSPLISSASTNSRQLRNLPGPFLSRTSTHWGVAANVNPDFHWRHMSRRLREEHEDFVRTGVYDGRDDAVLMGQARES
jgi:hypothetical protein